MRTVRRLLYRDIVTSVLYVATAFLALFFFIDLVGEFDNVGRQSYTTWTAIQVSLLELPGHFYELFPIAVLIGTIFSLARFAQSSEYTILRTGGLGPGRALALLAGLGAAFSAATFVVGDVVVPASEREVVRLKAEARGGRQLGRTGAWLKDRRQEGGAERAVSVNVQRLGGDGDLEDVRIFEFDGAGRLVERIVARRASVDDDRVWTLFDVERSLWPAAEQRVATGDADAPAVQTERLAQWTWRSNLAASVVAAAVQPVSTMSTAELWRYASHLAEQEQAAQRHAIQFWKKALYPFACLVMVALALPFAYLHARAGGISYKVFGGIMLGIAFVLLNNVAGHLGLLRDWTPWIAAAAPGAIFLLLSLGAFAWLVRYR
ncbi:MAG: LPS export ABC transporter permease LptG [Burkholderiaceae bacterium]|jgi:lipopolysaccharide export system permease protein|nr:LPS export ABC transporter permease LptG [Burkholderiaceae bacterium]